MRAQILQAVGVFFVARGFGGLGFNAAVAAADFFDDVGEADQISFDSQQASFGVFFLGFESADASGFFEDDSTFFGVGRQHPFDLALFDQTIGVGANSGAAEEFANVF